MEEQNKDKESQPGYKYLLTYQQIEEIQDLTIEFCNRFLSGRENLRIREQMESAIRSSKQCLAEGYSEESLKSYIYLAGVSKASLVELKEDYEDFAKRYGVVVWPRTPERDKWVKWVMDRQDKRHLFLTSGKPLDPLFPLNYLINLVSMTTYLLDRQIAALKKKFIEQGGYTENLFKKRMEYRRRTERDKRVKREVDIEKKEKEARNIYKKYKKKK